MCCVVAFCFSFPQASPRPVLGRDDRSQAVRGRARPLEGRILAEDKKHTPKATRAEAKLKQSGSQAAEHNQEGVVWSGSRYQSYGHSTSFEVSYTTKHRLLQQDVNQDCSSQCADCWLSFRKLPFWMLAVLLTPAELQNRSCRQPSTKFTK